MHSVGKDQILMQAENYALWGDILAAERAFSLAKTYALWAIMEYHLMRYEQVDYSLTNRSIEIVP